MNIEGDLKLEGIHADSNATVRGGNVDCNKKIIKINIKCYTYVCRHLSNLRSRRRHNRIFVKDDVNH